MSPSDLAQRLREASVSRDVSLGFIPEAHADLLRAAAEALEGIAHVALFVCRCEDEFRSLDKFTEHRQMVHDEPRKAR